MTLIRTPIDLPPDTGLKIQGMRIKRGVDIQQTIYKYHDDHAEGQDAMDYIFQGADSDSGFMTGVSVDTMANVRYDVVEVSYEDIISEEYPVKRYAQKGATTPRLLSYHDDYLTWWDNSIIYKTSDKAADTPETITLATWQAVTNGTIPNDKIYHKWLKATAAVPTGWEIWKSGGDDGKAKHAGKTSYLLPTVEVVETVLCKEESTAIDASVEPASRFAPDNTFGYPSANNLWMVFGSSITRQGPWYLTTNIYRYAAGGWEEDFYG